MTTHKQPAMDEAKCTRCPAPLPAESRICPACGADNGFPNVRLASKPEEIAALERRFSDATISAQARNVTSVLARFIAAVDKSVAVIARPLAVIQDLAAADNRFYGSHLKQLNAGIKAAAGYFDQIRPQFENAVLPNFVDEITFACLSLDGNGLRAYGEYSLVLRETAISDRATVFEENPYVLLNKKLKLVIGTPVPAGYRAIWPERSKLAAAKLHAFLEPNTTDQEFQHILLKDDSDTAGSDYLEVHIFGTISRRSVERLICPQPKSKADRAILNQLNKLLVEAGVVVEIR